MTQAETTQTTEADVIPIEQVRSKRRTSAFVKTTIAERVLNALAYTLNEDDLAVIYGEPGVGKTRSIEQFREQVEASKGSHVWVTTVAPSISTVVPMLTAIATTLGVVATDGGARTLHTTICRRLASTRRSILIVDEAQHLKKNSIEELRAIHDATGNAVALVGNDEVYKRLSLHPQLHSRVGVRLRLERPRNVDVQAFVASRWGSTDNETIEILDQISQLPGALRLVAKVMNASSRARNVKGVRGACKMLGVDLGGVS